MINSKAIDILKTFTTEEFRQFGFFIRSPFFNRELVLVEFYELLKKHYPLFNSRRFTRERIFEKLYKQKKYNDGMMRNILSKTLSLAGEFLAVKNFTDNKFALSLNLMEELSDKKQEKLFNKAKKSAEALLRLNNTRDESYYHSRFLLEDAGRRFILKQKSAGDNRTVDILITVQKSLTSEFLIKIFKNAGYMLNNRRKMYTQEINTDLLDKLEEYLLAGKENFRNELYVWYYFFIYKLAKTREEKYFFELKKILLKKYDKLDIPDKKNIYVVLANYCYVKVNRGEDKFLKEHFVLLKENVEKGHYLTSQKYLSHIFYINVIIAGLGSGEKEWVKNFIDDFKEKLDDTNRENSYTFGCALYYYHLRQFAKALKFASRVETNDISYKHQVKSFYLKIYFDMNEADAFYSHVDSYRHFIAGDRNTSKEMNDAIGNYITFTNRLFSIQSAAEDKGFELGKLANEISESKNLINRQWLLNRVSKTVRSRKY